MFLYVKREFMDQRIVPQGQLEEVVQVDDAFGEKVEFIVVQEETQGIFWYQLHDPIGQVEWEEVFLIRLEHWRF